MPWTQLFKVNSFEAALKKRKGLFTIDPILAGNKLSKVKKVFKMTQIPFVWDPREILRQNNHNSPYNKFPKGIAKEEKRIYERLLTLRNGIAQAKEKELKYRQESLNKRPYKGMERLIKLTMPFMIKQTSLKPEASIGGRARSRKMVGEFVKEVPRNKNIAFGRRNQERIKNLMEDKVLDTSNIVEASRAKPTPVNKAEANKPKVTPAAEVPKKVEKKNESSSSDDE